MLYVAVAVHAPIAIWAAAAHDDGLYLRLAQSLIAGEWLGAYSDTTLAKGPGYPLFLAAAKILGLPVSLAQSLLHGASATVFAIAFQRLTRRPVLSGVVFLLLLWHPLTLSGAALRIIRDVVYSDQTILLVGLAIIVFVNLPRFRIGTALLIGVVLGWSLLTREEGLWIAPGLALLLACALARARHQRCVGRLAVTIVIMTGACLSIQLAFRAINATAYGSFVAVDFKERNFQRALRALHSVRSGGVKPLIAVTAGARRAIYPISPSFAGLEDYFDQGGDAGPSAQIWGRVTCLRTPASCGEIGAGYFVWALRDAAARQGHYRTPASASRFFGAIADEIENACGRKALDCHPQLIAELPPITWSDVLARMPTDIVRVIEFGYRFLATPSPDAPASNGPDAQIAAALDLLGHPRHVPSSRSEALTVFRVSGWYYSAGSEWFTARVRTSDGRLVALTSERETSPDIAAAFKDPQAHAQRFTLSFACGNDCLIEIENLKGEKLVKPLSEIEPQKAFKIGEASLFPTAFEGVARSPARAQPVDGVLNAIRRWILSLYPAVIFPVFAAGALCLVIATALRCRGGVRSDCLMLAWITWILFGSRIGLLALIEATSFVARDPNYLGPAFYLAVMGSVLSIAAAMQLSSSSARSTCRSRQDGGVVKATPSIVG